MIVFKDKKDTYLHLFDLDYVNEINPREFVLTLPKGKYIATNLFTDKKHQFTTNFKHTFKKYDAYKINLVK
ncbi:MAG: hypothetical protein MJ213_03410 [Bacilli bacterium]|nr:hypothetical protein [Bacilli bacterium]